PTLGWASRARQGSGKSTGDGSADEAAGTLGAAEVRRPLARGGAHRPTARERTMYVPQTGSFTSSSLEMRGRAVVGLDRGRRRSNGSSATTTSAIQSAR